MRFIGMLHGFSLVHCATVAHFNQTWTRDTNRFLTTGFSIQC
jgi:hypothetical protein